MLLCMWCFFFFQAEDGIRDLVRSRGLGDVYKRQVLAGNRALEARREITDASAVGLENQGEASGGVEPVSYTHLTLPTSDLV